MLPVAPIVLLGALVYTFTSFLRYVSGRQWSSALTILVAWAGGVGSVFLFAETQFGDQVRVGTVAVASFNLSTKLLIGFLASSLFAAFRDLTKAVDNTQTTKMPSLIAPKAAPIPRRTGVGDVALAPEYQKVSDATHANALADHAASTARKRAPRRTGK
jgi:predicted solute-binding protein